MALPLPRDHSASPGDPSSVVTVCVPDTHCTSVRHAPPPSAWPEFGGGFSPTRPLRCSRAGETAVRRARDPASGLGSHHGRDHRPDDRWAGDRHRSIRHSWRVMEPPRCSHRSRPRALVGRAGIVTRPTSRRPRPERRLRATNGPHDLTEPGHPRPPGEPRCPAKVSLAGLTARFAGRGRAVETFQGHAPRGDPLCSARERPRSAVLDTP